MQDLIKKVEDTYRKKQVVDVRSGDTVRVHQKIKEGSKERVQVFEGFVIRTDRKKSVTSRITVRRVASGVGVEKSFLLHSPLITKVEVIKRAKVRRKNLTFMRRRSGKSARLAGVDFDKDAVNTLEKMIDAEVGKAEIKESEEVNKKEKTSDQPVSADTESETTEKPDTEKDTEPKPKDSQSKSKNAEKDEKRVEATEEETTDGKKLTKKEKAEAFRKKQEEKSK